MEREGSLPCTEEPTSGQCPEPFESSPYPHTFKIRPTKFQERTPLKPRCTAADVSRCHARDTYKLTPERGSTDSERHVISHNKSSLKYLRAATDLRR
jgi:hypothetical protein